ncbi:MAG TPA: FAD-binding oxidoreductase [Polyangiaceae bacterium]
MSTGSFEVELIAREALSARVHRLRCRARAPFRWAAGQYIVVARARELGEELNLPYSIASAYDPKQPGEFEIAASYHAGADAIDALSVGATLVIEGPRGSFTWREDASPAALLVGVGTGVAPLRALIQEELARPTATRLVLLAGHRAPDDVLFERDFAQFAAEYARFEFVPTLTGEAEHWLGRRGRVQTQLATAVSALGRFDAYVCGRVDMVHEVRAALDLLGVPPERVRSEGY